MTRIAILDDYHNVSLKLADWESLPGSPEITGVRALSTPRSIPDNNLWSPRRFALRSVGDANEQASAGHRQRH